MPSGNNILQKCQQAARDYIIAAGLDWITSASIVSGLSRGPADEDFDVEVSSTDLPAIVCKCSNASMIHEANSGNWNCSLEILVRMHAQDTTEDTALDRFSEVADLFMDSGTAEAGLSEYDGFTAFAIRVTGQNYAISGKAWDLTLTCEVDCCGSNIS